MRELHSVAEVREHLTKTNHLENVVIQSVDLSEPSLARHNASGVSGQLLQANVCGTVFLGCQLPDHLLCDVARRGAFVFPQLPELPFNPYQPKLYDTDTLFDNFDSSDPCSYCRTTDARIYEHWSATGRSTPASITEGLARRLHDHSMTDALHDFLDAQGRRDRVVAIMGGHAMQRSDPNYLLVAQISRTLTRAGHLMISGGGPGAMEATHVGAWFADRSEDDLEQGVAQLAAEPSYKDYRWLAAAFEVMERFPAPSDQHISLGIPTWLYGHEPPTPFASHIAKYFANSVREEGLITIASAGIIFSPGSAGTIQEIFQDAAQNHYATTGWACPMVFLDQHAWTVEKPIYNLLQQLAAGEPYRNLLGIFDDHDGVVEFLRDHPPVRIEGKQWSFCSEFCGTKKK